MRSTRVCTENTWFGNGVMGAEKNKMKWKKKFNYVASLSRTRKESASVPPMFNLITESEEIWMKPNVTVITLVISALCNWEISYRIPGIIVNSISNKLLLEPSMELRTMKLMEFLDKLEERVDILCIEKQSPGSDEVMGVGIKSGQRSLQCGYHIFSWSLILRETWNLFYTFRKIICDATDSSDHVSWVVLNLYISIKSLHCTCIYIF